MLAYGSVRLWEAPLHLLAPVNAQLFIATGQTKYPMRAAWAMVVVNAALAYMVALAAKP